MTPRDPDWQRKHCEAHGMRLLRANDDTTGGFTVTVTLSNARLFASAALKKADEEFMLAAKEAAGSLKSANWCLSILHVV